MLRGDRVPGRLRQVEAAVKEVYEYCPPTKMHYASGRARAEHQAFWGQFFSRLGVRPEDFRGLRVLDAGCGSADKACFYHDWGAKVTGVDVTASVLALARETIGNRDIELIRVSLFDLPGREEFDLAISDGVLMATADTFAALEAVVANVRMGGRVIFSLVNVLGAFWWFPLARLAARLLGGSDFHRRAAWGKRLFRRFRRGQEGTSETASAHRSEDSWAYDWFGNPRWNLHSPGEVREWLARLGLRHVQSVPSVISKEEPRTLGARLFRKVFGGGSFLIGTYWLLNKEPNMMYVCAEKIGRPARARGRTR